jgi:hypothetical protein
LTIFGFIGNALLSAFNILNLFCSVRKKVKALFNLLRGRVSYYIFTFYKYFAPLGQDWLLSTKKTVPAVQNIYRIVISPNALSAVGMKQYYFNQKKPPFQEAFNI